MTSASFDPVYLELARDCAREAGGIIQQLRDDRAPVTVKGRGDVATRADQAAEAAIIARIQRALPGQPIFAEESGGAPIGSEPTWVVDPLDGTYNYAMGIPVYSVSIALVEQGRPVVGVIYDPCRDELYEAGRGIGARLNGKPLRVSPIDRLPDCVLGFDLGYHDDRAQHALRIATHLWGNYQFFRTIGSAALGLAYAASGRFGIYFHHFVRPWDFAAGWLLVEEAAGLATAYGGEPLKFASTNILAGNPELHRQFVTAIAPLGPLPD